MSKPLFTIGITTYNRHQFLKESLTELLSQPFKDIEILVGNDYVKEPFTQQDLGFNEPRLKIVNHAENMGEYNNLNWLCNNASGRYFTWLADDDMHTPWLLTDVYEALKKFDYPVWVFTGCIQGEHYPRHLKHQKVEPQLLSGKDLAHLYLSKQITTHLVYGFFDRERLRKPGEVDILAPYAGAQLYVDPQLCFRAALLDEVAFINSPLLFFRTHAGSMSLTNVDPRPYIAAQDELCQHGAETFSHPKIKDAFVSNMDLLIQRRVEEVFSVMARSGRFEPDLVLKYLKQTKKYVSLLGKQQFATWAEVMKIFAKIYLRSCKNRLLSPALSQQKAVSQEKV